jgi:hypothetical protein
MQQAGEDVEARRSSGMLRAEHLLAYRQRAHASSRCQSIFFGSDLFDISLARLCSSTLEASIASVIWSSIFCIEGSKPRLLIADRRQHTQRDRSRSVPVDRHQKRMRIALECV